MCVGLSVYVGCQDPHSPPLDPYILDTCDMFVPLCHMLEMSSIRVKLGVADHSCALPEGGGVQTHGKSQYYRVP